MSLQFYKSSLNSNSNIQRIVFGWLSFLVLDGLFFGVLDPFTLGGCNFFNSNPFLMILNASDAQIRRVQVLFGLQKQWSPPLRSGLPWALKWSHMGCSTVVGTRGKESNKFLLKRTKCKEANIKYLVFFLLAWLLVWERCSGTHPPHVGRDDAPFIICAQGVQQLSSSLAVPNPHLFQCYKVVL